MSTVILRQLQWPEDVEKLDLIDTCITVNLIFDVRLESRGFSIVEKAMEPSYRKQYTVNWRELGSASMAIVAEREDMLVGVATLEYEAWNRRAIISHLYVDRAARGQGVGTRLLRELISRANGLNARQLFVETQNVNVQAIRFYERNGFDLVGLDTSLYDTAGITGETALYFAMRLGAPRT